MKVLVCGSRGFRAYGAVFARLSLLPRETEVIHGNAPGADSLADRAARRLGMKVTPFPARWRVNGVYNPRAGFERNSEMLSTEPDLVLAFWDGSSHGTKDTLDKARARGIEVEVIR